MVRPGASFPFKAIAARAGSTSPRGAPHHARQNPVLSLLSLSLFFYLNLIFFLIFLHRSPRGCHWRAVKLQRPAMVDGRWRRYGNPGASLLEPGGQLRGYCPATLACCGIDSSLFPLINYVKIRYLGFDVLSCTHR